VTPDERALSSWSFLNQMLFNGAFLGGFFRVLSLAVVPRDEGPDFCRAFIRFGRPASAASFRETETTARVR